MPNIFGLRKGLYPRAEESMARMTTSFFQASGACTASGRYGVDPNQYVLFLNSESNLPKAYLYFPRDDAWILLPNPPAPGTVNSGTCSAWHPVGPTLSPTSATSTTAVFTLATAIDLTGYTVRILSGTGAGQERAILSSTYGSPCTITVDAWTVTPDATSVIQLRTGRFYALIGQTILAGSFSYFDMATLTWTSLSVTGLPGAFATSGGIAAPNSTVFVSGQATAGGASTLTNAAKTWTVNQWTNYQIRITGGTGAGQRRTISSNTGTVVTVSSAWTIQPDNTSLYNIEANEDLLYLSGGGATTVYKYSISGNSWSTISAARTVIPWGGQSFNHIDEEPSPAWLDESNYLNGRFIYSYPSRGNLAIDRLNITTETWENNVAPHNRYVLWGTSTHVYVNGYIYTNLTVVSGIHGTWIRFRPSENYQTPWYVSNTEVTAAVDTNWDMNRAFPYKYVENGKVITFIYCLGQPSLVYRIQETD